MYICKELDENQINKQILDKLSKLQSNNYTIIEILNYLMTEHPPIFTIIFGKMLCSYFEGEHKSYTEKQIMNAEEKDFFKSFTLEEFFYKNKDLMNDFHNDFEKYKEALHEVARKEKILKEYQTIKEIEDFNFSLYVLNAMYKKKSVKEIYVDIMSKKSGIENIDKLFQNFKESQKQLNKNKIYKENFTHIYKVYNPLFPIESFLIDYYAYCKGKQIKKEPENKIDEEFIFIVENKDNLEEYFRNNRFVLGIFCIQYLKYICDLESQKEREILNIGKKTEDAKKLMKQIQDHNKNR